MLYRQHFVDECDDIREFMCLYTLKPEPDQTGLKLISEILVKFTCLDVTQELVFLMFSRHS